jgi:2-polyprenyl-3-methyl-5-hydroxy-6-metoxy-1,4-benzoquinol methylase
MSDDPTASKTYYDQRFGNQPQRLNEEETARWRAIQQSLAILRLPPPVRIADFGCGRGWLSGKLSEFGEVTGFDLSEKSIQNASHSYPSLHFICLDASAEIPHHFTGCFDVVVSSEVVEHVHHQREYISNAALLLKSSGLLVLTTPNGRWRDTFYEGDRSKWKQPVENWITASELTDMIGGANLTLHHLSSFQGEWVFNYRPKLPIAWIAYPPTRKLLKAFGLYPVVIKMLNRRMFGLNLIAVAKK